MKIIRAAVEYLDPEAKRDEVTSKLSVNVFVFVNFIQ